MVDRDKVIETLKTPDVVNEKSNTNQLELKINQYDLPILASANPGDKISFIVWATVKEENNGEYVLFVDEIQSADKEIPLDPDELDGPTAVNEPSLLDSVSERKKSEQKPATK